VQSNATAEYGWRVTPYAYVLLKARGAEVDRLPPVSMDLDFLDTSGYVVLPIESPAVPIDAASPAEPRPCENLKVVQTLDERQADKGKLILELKATGNGLVPPLEDVVALDVPGFTVAEIEKQPVAVSRFDPEQKENLVVSERIWTVNLVAEADTPPATEFAFPAAASDAIPAAMTYQRFDDADIVHVEPTVLLAERYAAPDWSWAGMSAIAVALLVLCVAGVLFLRPKPKQVEAPAYRMPRQITPFTVIGLLQTIRRDGHLDEGTDRELTGVIHHIEEHYFADRQAPAVDLHQTASTWLERVGARSTNGA
jgi:hypothetical protein